MQTDPTIFEEQLWRLNENGDFNSTLNVVNITVDMKYKDRHGNLIDLAYLIEKYKAYTVWWDNKFGERDPKFIRNSDSLKAIYDFIGDELYRQEWKSPPKIRDAYLFGNLTTEALNESLRKFKSSIHRS
jgi:hypothetical protein